MLTLGGSVVTTTIPPSFITLQNPGNVAVLHDASALAAYYNSTLTQIGRGNFSGASFLLMTFPFVNISPAVNGTAQAANSDLAVVNSSSAVATSLLGQAKKDIGNNQLLNATVLISQGCLAARDANRSLADFQGPQTSRFGAESIPTGQYSKGSGLASAEVASLLAVCSSLQKGTPSAGTSAVLLIGSPQRSVETGGPLRLVGNLTLGGAGVPGQEVLFFVNGTYFGSLQTDAGGRVGGTLVLPFLYTRTVVVQALTAPNGTQRTSGASSNTLVLQLLFNETAISIGDPPAVLPTFSFGVHGNLTTIDGVGLPYAPVRVTFLNESLMVRTDAKGGFGATLVVPANATDGIYDVYASFAPQGVFGPSFNFTSVQVVHLPLLVSLRAPALSLAGFSTTLQGTARSNGSAVANATITVDSPWGSVSTKTNSTGGFRVSLAVSPLEFAFSKDVTASGTAPQPYVAPGTVVISIGLFNILLVILPIAAVGIIGYEADRLGAFEGLRSRSKREGAALEPLTVVGESLARSEAPGGQELLQIYRRALIIAQARLQVRFRPSQTIREIIAAAQKASAGLSVAAFADVMLTVEDFLYAQTFDPSRVASARKRLDDQEAEWK